MKNEYDYLNDVKMDFSIYNEEYVTEEEILKMSEINNSNKKASKKKFVVAVCAAVLVVSTGVLAAEGHLERIINTVTTGHNYFMQINPEAPHELPDGLKGKIFNADNEPLEAISDSDLNNLYDEEGNLIDNTRLAKMFEEAMGVDLDTDEYSTTEEVSYATIEEAQENAVFDIKYPEYIPEGFEFSRAHNLKDENGNVSGLYMTLEYKDEKGRILGIHERLLNEETAFVASSDGELEEMETNGRKTVIMDGRNLNFETEDSVSVGIYTKGNISKEEMIKMAESIK